MKDENLLGKMVPTEFFKSETFSDVVVECEGQTFPAHRIILAGKINKTLEFTPEFLGNGFVIILV